MRQQFFLIFNRISDTWRLIFENLRNFEKILLHKNFQNSSALLKITITIIFRFHFINVAEIFKILKKNSLQNLTINTEKVRQKKRNSKN